MQYWVKLNTFRDSSESKRRAMGGQRWVKLNIVEDTPESKLSSISSIQDSPQSKLIAIRDSAELSDFGDSSKLELSPVWDSAESRCKIFHNSKFYIIQDFVKICQLIFFILLFGAILQHNRVKLSWLFMTFLSFINTMSRSKSFKTGITFRTLWT